MKSPSRSPTRPSSSSSARATRSSSRVTSSASATGRRSGSSTRARSRRWISREHSCCTPRPACARSATSTSRSASERRPPRAWSGSQSRSARSTASARSAARAASPTRRSSRCASTAWSISRSSAARPRSRRPRSRRSRRSPGRSSCPSASGNSASRTSARSPSASTPTATRSTTTSRPQRTRSWRRSMPSSNGFLDLPPRPGKPRAEGLTHVIDKGLNLREIEGMFDTAGQYVDIVKLGWGTSYVTNNLEKKIALYRSFETPVVCGGTLFEAVYARGKLDEFKRWLIEQRFSHVEISDGTLEIPRERKLELIADFAADFTVLSEVGSKDAEVNIAPYLWVEWIKEELDAGAWKVITEGREGGTAGIYRSDGEMRTGLVDEIVHEVDVSNLVFEAPQKSSQAWFVKQFGPNVNLGNIPPEEVIPLETLRLGLRGDTLKEVLLDGERTPAP